MFSKTIVNVFTTYLNYIKILKTVHSTYHKLNGRPNGFIFLLNISFKFIFLYLY
jgi:hypothetical protein